jgi:hypothetical protein
MHAMTYKGTQYVTQPFIFGLDIAEQGIAAMDEY